MAGKITDALKPQVANHEAPVLVVGLGDLGGRIAEACAALTPTVLGMRRRPEPVNGVQVIAHDAGEPWPTLPDTPRDVVLCLSPGGRSVENYRAVYPGVARTALDWLQRHAPSAHVWLISSTSVYGQNQGEWVTEDSPAEPERDTAREIREAERIWLDSPQPATVLRPAGIYGPGRDRLLREALKGYRITDPQPVYTNRIHVEDVARAVRYLINRRRQEKETPTILNLADRDAVSWQTLMPWLQAELGVTPDSERTLDRGSKRVSSERLAATGFDWLYPSYRDGYRPIIEAFSQSFESIYKRRER